MEFLYAADKPTKSAASSNSKPKSVPEIDFAADADAEQDVDLSDLVVPVALLSKPPKASERQKFGEEMEGLINEGFDPKEKALNAAKKRFETARRIIPGDPRPYYAHGLILLSHRQSPMALDAFKAAAKQIQKPYLPALQMLVWTHAARSDMPQTLAAAIELARSLESSSGSYPVAEDRVYAAEWLGRMLGYLEGPAKTETQSARIDATVMEIAGMLTGDRQQAFVQGRQSTGERFQELTALSNLSDAKLQAELKRQVAAAGPAAEGAREELKRCTDDLKKLKVPFEQSQAE
ncbi:MAG: hypothetical protein JSS02_28755, partial [Planctomycetes bacterium]|nr:hypothetical protein [Planctomycetota bacterium]